MVLPLTTLKVTGLAHWASYLVNDDDSGLEVAEKAEADEWFDALLCEHPTAVNVTVVDCGESYLARFNGLLSDVVEYEVAVYGAIEVRLPTVEEAHAKRVLGALTTAMSLMDHRFREAHEALSSDLPVTERVRIGNLCAEYKRERAAYQDTLREILEGLPIGRSRAAEVNGEGLTWEQWQGAARSGNSREYRLAWRRGEDPTEWTAR